MEGMRISALVSLAKGFWGTPSHLVDYSYLDHLGVTTEVRNFPQENWHDIFKKEGRKKGGTKGREDG